MKKVTLKFLWKNIKLNLIEDKYINNNKIFYKKYIFQRMIPGIYTPKRNTKRNRKI